MDKMEEEQVIELSCDSSLKLQYDKDKLLEFWISVSHEYRTISTAALRVLLPFATSYLCETGFSAVAEVVESPPGRYDSVSTVIEQLDVDHDGSAATEDWNRPGTSAKLTLFLPLRGAEGSQSEPRSINSPTAASKPPLIPEETGQSVRSETGFMGGGLPPATGTPLPSTSARHHHYSLAPNTS
ncbi:hypothetical protein evm_014284 [Chilo suppressalis]|nr:hypothetical protein evm_014284 [Chilo suppressalis]